MPPLERVFVVNLVRRRDRAFAMREALKAASFSAPVEWFRAVDGLEVSGDFLGALGCKPYENWKQPIPVVRYHNRDLKMGELGCALSHWMIWRRIDDEDFGAALILEDDAEVIPDLGPQIDEHLAVLDAAMPDWDLLYVGRKRAVEQPYIDVPEGEDLWPPEVPIAGNLVVPTFSWCTHAYVLSARGARKLLDARLDQNLVPVDDMLPAMYAWHPRPDVRAIFGDGNRIKAAAIHPMLSIQVDQHSDTERSAEIRWSE